MNILEALRNKSKGHAQHARVASVPASTPAPYTMKALDKDSAEIVLYGDIVSEQPTDWWGDPIDGQFIVLSQFLEDFKQVENTKHLTVRIHSAGGNAYDAMVIHNKLKSMAAEVTVIVDGIAMSGGSLIMCAGDTVKVFPGSLVMIHKCWTFLFGGYNATEMRRMADSNDAVDRSQAAIYQAKTGMQATDLLELMEKETYMTGQEAIDAGFADEFEDGSGLAIAASADRRTLYVQGVPVWASTREGGIPKALNLPTVETAGGAVKINVIQPAQSGNNEGGKIMAKTLEELKKEDPELAAQLMAEAQAAASAESTASGNGAEAERQRLKEIDEISACFSEEMVQDAKYGENPCTAQELTYRAAKEMAKQGKKFVKELEDDTEDSGTNKVNALPGGDDGTLDGEAVTEEQRMANARSQVQSLLGKKKEGKS